MYSILLAWPAIRQLEADCQSDSNEEARMDPTHIEIIVFTHLN